MNETDTFSLCFEPDHAGMVHEGRMSVASDRAEAQVTVSARALAP